MMLVKKLDWQMKTKNRQQGAALIVGLVVLILLTLLGVSAMNMTTLDTRTSSNTQNRNNIFQSAGSLLDHIFYAVGNDPYRIDLTNPVNTQVMPVFNSGHASVTSTVERAADVPGNPLKRPTPLDCNAAMRGFSLGIECDAYEIRVVSNDANSSANSNQFQGLVAPGKSKR